MEEAHDLNRYKERIATYGAFDLDRLDASVVPPVGVESSMTLMSTGDKSAPVVGDLLWVDIVYASASRNVKDTNGSIFDFKRGGISIPLIENATQYEITEDDIGETISLELTIKEQDGTFQTPLTESLTGVVTGSAGFTMGKVQDKFNVLFRFDDSTYPKITSYNKDDNTEVFKVNSIAGNGYHLIPQALANAWTFDPSGYCYGLSINCRSFFNRHVSGFDGSNFTFACRIQINGTATARIIQKLGTTLREIYWNSVDPHIRISGLTDIGANTFPKDEWGTILLRCSDTDFLASDGVTTCKTELWTQTPTGGIAFTTHATNKFTGMNADNGGWILNTSQWIKPAAHKMKLFGFSNQLIDNTTFNLMKTKLNTL